MLQHLLRPARKQSIFPGRWRWRKPDPPPIETCQNRLEKDKTIFVTHKHLDHITGIIWMIRMICQSMKQGEYEGEAVMYAHDEVTTLLQDFSEKLLQKKDTEFIGKRLHLIPVADGESKEILNKKVTFFDIQSTKARQFGFAWNWEMGRN